MVFQTEQQSSKPLGKEINSATLLLLRHQLPHYGHGSTACTHSFSFLPHSEKTVFRKYASKKHLYIHMINKQEKNQQQIYHTLYNTSNRLQAPGQNPSP